MLTADQQKRVVVKQAANLVETDMLVGLGTGSTASYLVEELGIRWSDGLRFTAVATSSATQKLAETKGIPVVDLDSVQIIDVAFDGADEVDPKLDLVKGLGGALLREKLVESSASRLVIMVDETKLVDRLGQRSPVPVEVVPFGWRHTSARLSKLGIVPSLRGGSEQPFITDGGHVILDCRFEPRERVTELAALLKAVVGVVEHGLFLGMCTDLMIGRGDGTVETRRRAGPHGVVSAVTVARPKQ